MFTSFHQCCGVIIELAPQKKPKPTGGRRRTKSIHKRINKIIGNRNESTQSALAGRESSSAGIDEIYTFNDDDAEEDVCVVDLPTSTIDAPYGSGADYIVQLKSQTAANTSGKMNSKKKRGVRRGSGTSSEEERWLVAIESGKLEQVDDELKKIKDPKLMTARQRAMYERNIDKEPSPGSGACSGGDTLKSLPIGSKEKILSAEAIEKAQLKSQKRKQMADEKREKNKRETRDRLLKKQETKVTKMIKSKMIVKVEAPVVSYYMGTTGAYVSFPKDFEIPIKTQLPRPPPPPIQLCGICNEDKKRYNCSKTNVPLCSIQCYKLNLERQQINQSR